MREIFREYADRMVPVAVIPMHTPQEAIEELEYAVQTIGLKAVMMAGHVVAPDPDGGADLAKLPATPSGSIPFASTAHTTMIRCGRNASN